ncbi:MAG: hypothetical protein AAB289_15385 [Chloroflexota bacterium]
MTRRTAVALLGVVALTLAFRLPSLFEPPWYDDEGIYAAVAHALLRGDRLYKDVLDNRPPGIYWLYAAMLAVSGYSVAFVKLTATVSFLLTQLAVFQMARRLWDPLTALVVIALFGFLGSIPMLEGNLANAEIFMILPVTLGMLLAMGQRWFAAGVALGCALLIKQIAGLEALAIVAGLLMFHPRPAAALLRFGAGYVIPCLIAAGYLWSQGTIADFWYVCVSYYFGYVQRETRIPVEFWALKLVVLGLSAACIGWFMRGPRSIARFQRGLVLIWTAAAFYGAFFTSRPYPHYLLEPLPPLLMVLGWLFVANWRRPMADITGGKVAGAGGLAVAACSLFLIIYLPWPTWARPEKSIGYYQNFASLASGQITQAKYNDFFDRRVNRNMRLLRFLKQNTRPDDSLLIWGEEPWLYALTKLDVAPPFTVSYFAYEMPSGLQRMAESIAESRPHYIIWTRNKPLYPQLRAALENDYVEEFAYDNAVVFQRIPNRDTLGQTLGPAETNRGVPLR